MCTVVLLRRPNHPWPLILGANRDEMTSRPWRAPGRHWPDRPEVVAGLDQEAGGSWLGLNDHGVVAAVLNRRGSLGSQRDKRSRGELVLEALDHAEARPAAEALVHLDPLAYRSFNLVIADDREAFWLRNRAEDGPERVELIDLPPGLSMLTAGDRNDPTSPRVRTHFGRILSAPAPDPESGDWLAWEAILASRLHDTRDGPEAAMTVVTGGGFETVSSSLIALPARPVELGAQTRRPLWRFAPGRPDQTSYEEVAF
jgi:uncharacterized protein with NRDE domain